jgi:hypothetical protein
MTQNFTPDDVLLANSGELPDELCNLLKINLQEDTELEDFATSLQQIESGMNRLIPETDENLVQSILHRVQAIPKKA